MKASRAASSGGALILPASGVAPSGHAGAGDAGAHPARRRLRIERGGEIVAQRGGERSLQAGLGRHLVERRLECAALGKRRERREALRLALQRRQLVLRGPRRGPGLRLRALRLAALGLGGFERLAGFGQRRLGGGQRGFRLGAPRILGGAERGPVGLGLV